MSRPLYRVASFVLMLALAPGAHGDPLTLGQLMDALAHADHRTATFAETKYLSILDVPVESSGELEFEPPAHLEKRTLRPIAETLSLDGDTVTIVQLGRKRTLRLEELPEVATMIESLRATLAGDRKALERVYRLRLSGTSDRWTLELTPLDARVGRVVSRIAIAGAGGEVQRVEIQQADGDRSVMRVTPTAPP
jgi:hypothetical protein